VHIHSVQTLINGSAAAAQGWPDGQSEEISRASGLVLAGREKHCAWLRWTHGHDDTTSVRIHSADGGKKKKIT